MKTILPFLLLLPGLLFSQASGNLNFQQAQQNFSQFQDLSSSQGSQRQLGFSFKLMKNVEPDALLAVFNVVQLGETVEEVNRALQVRLDDLAKGLLALGIEEEDFFVDMISQVPIYEYEEERRLFSKNFVEVPAGFELQKNVHIRFTEAALLDRIVAVAGQQEIHDLTKVEYYLDDQAAVYEELRTEALALFETRKDFYRSLDLDLDTVFHSIAEQGQAYLPANRYTSYQAVQNYGFSKSGKGVTQARKPRAQFYNPVSYAGFDKVINPRILGPVVQLTYQLQVQYVLPNPFSQEVLMVVPEGELKRLSWPKE